MSDYTNTIKTEFGGLLNSLLIILVLIVCLRFSDAAWGTADVQMRFLRALYMFGSIISLSVIFVIIRAISLKVHPLQIKYGHPYFKAIMISAKYGFVTGGILVAIAGILIVNDFLDPFKDFIELTLSIFG
jgi:hypothetical protein